MSEKPTISIIIPALNEEGNIEDTVNTVRVALQDRFRDSELFIFNDGSTDRTGIIADRLAKEDSRIKVIHNSKNMGLGWNFSEGVRLAQHKYTVLVPGDNEISGDSISKMFQLVGNTDIVMLYTVNTWIRPLARRVVSRTFVGLMNSLFNLTIRYYNGPCAIRTALLKNIPLQNNSFAYMACILVRLLRGGATFVEEGMFIQPREYGGSHALSLKNFIRVSKDILNLFIEVLLRAKNKV